MKLINKIAITTTFFVALPATLSLVEIEKTNIDTISKVSSYSEVPDITININDGAWNDVIDTEDETFMNFSVKLPEGAEYDRDWNNSKEDNFDKYPFPGDEYKANPIRLYNVTKGRYQETFNYKLNTGGFEETGGKFLVTEMYPDSSNTFDFETSYHFDNYISLYYDKMFSISPKSNLVMVMDSQTNYNDGFTINGSLKDGGELTKFSSVKIVEKNGKIPTIDVTDQFDEEGNYSITYRNSNTFKAQTNYDLSLDVDAGSSGKFSLPFEFKTELEAPLAPSISFDTANAVETATTYSVKYTIRTFHDDKHAPTVIEKVYLNDENGVKIQDLDENKNTGTINLTNLSPNKEYKYKLVVESNAGKIAKDLTFNLNENAPQKATVESLNVVPIEGSYTNAIISYSINLPPHKPNTTDTVITHVELQWGKWRSILSNDKLSYSFEINNLEPDKDYTFKLIVESNGGTDTKEFYLPARYESPVLPTVTIDKDSEVKTSTSYSVDYSIDTTSEPDHVQTLIYTVRVYDSEGNKIKFKKPLSSSNGTIELNDLLPEINYTYTLVVESNAGEVVTPFSFTLSKDEPKKATVLSLSANAIEGQNDSALIKYEIDSPIETEITEGTEVTKVELSYDDKTIDLGTDLKGTKTISGLEPNETYDFTLKVESNGGVDTKTISYYTGLLPANLPVVKIDQSSEIKTSTTYDVNYSIFTENNEDYVSTLIDNVYVLDSNGENVEFDEPLSKTDGTIKLNNLLPEMDYTYDLVVESNAGQVVTPFSFSLTKDIPEKATIISFNANPIEGLNDSILIDYDIDSPTGTDIVESTKINSVKLSYDDEIIDLGTESNGEVTINNLEPNEEYSFTLTVNSNGGVDTKTINCKTNSSGIISPEITTNALPLSSSEVKVYYKVNIPFNYQYDETIIDKVTINFDNRGEQEIYLDENNEGSFIVDGLSPNTKYSYSINVYYNDKYKAIKENTVKTLPSLDGNISIDTDGDGNPDITVIIPNDSNNGGIDLDNDGNIDVEFPAISSDPILIDADNDNVIDGIDINGDGNSDIGVSIDGNGNYGIDFDNDGHVDVNLVDTDNDGKPNKFGKVRVTNEAIVDLDYGMTIIDDSITSTSFQAKIKIDGAIADPSSDAFTKIQFKYEGNALESKLVDYDKENSLFTYEINGFDDNMEFKEDAWSIHSLDKDYLKSDRTKMLKSDALTNRSIIDDYSDFDINANKSFFIGNNRSWRIIAVILLIIFALGLLFILIMWIVRRRQVKVVKIQKVSNGRVDFVINKNTQWKLFNSLSSRTLIGEQRKKKAKINYSTSVTPKGEIIISLHDIANGKPIKKLVFLKTSMDKTIKVKGKISTSLTLSYKQNSKKLGYNNRSKQTPKITSRRRISMSKEISGNNQIDNRTKRIISFDERRSISSSNKGTFSTSRDEEREKLKKKVLSNSVDKSDIQNKIKKLNLTELWGIGIKREQFFNSFKICNVYDLSRLNIDDIPKKVIKGLPALNSWTYNDKKLAIFTNINEAKFMINELTKNN